MDVTGTEKLMPMGVPPIVSNTTRTAPQSSTTAILKAGRPSLNPMWVTTTDVQAQTGALCAAAGDGAASASMAGALHTTPAPTPNFLISARRDVALLLGSAIVLPSEIPPIDATAPNTESSHTTSKIASKAKVPWPLVCDNLNRRRVDPCADLSPSLGGMGDYAQDELELGDYLAILKRRWVWFLLPILMVPAVAYYLSTSQADSYDASTQVLLSDSAAQDAIGGGSQSISFRNRILENEISLARSDQAFEEIAERLGRDPDDVPEFSVSAEADSDVLVFSATAGTPENAATIANVAAGSYVFLKQQQAQASIVGAVETLEQRLVELQADRDEVRAELVRLEDQLAVATDETRAAAQAQVDREESRISGQLALIDAQIAATADSITELELAGELALGGTARIVSVANPPLSSSNAPLSRNLVLGVVVGAILGAALALLRENLDNKIRTTEDLERLGLVPLGSIPRASGRENDKLELARICQESPDTPQAQGHQKTQAAVRFIAGQHEINNVLITSASQGEGKTTLASNLAISMALSNVRTVLVDLDLRRPRVHKVYGLPQAPGITSVVVDGYDIVGSATLIADLDEHLAVVPAGKLPPHAASFISSSGFAETVKELSKLSDFTVFDAPPVLPVADTLTLAQLVDGVILAVYANQTTKDELERTAESLSASGARIIGAVLLGAPADSSSYDYYNNSDELERM